MFKSVKKYFLIISKRLITKYIIFFNILVFHQADTLKFVKGDSVIDKWVLDEKIEKTDLGTVIHSKKSKVSQDNKYFIYYEEEYYSKRDSFVTTLSLYDARKRKLWERSPENNRKISFYLTNIYKDFVILVTTDNYNLNPSLKFIKDKKVKEIIKEKEWQRIVKYEFSPNIQYLLLHVKNPYNTKMWDYVHCIDLKSKKTWTYLFPICVSCKKYKLDLSIDNNGKAQVIYKNRHRIFSKNGTLIDIFIKL